MNISGQLTLTVTDKNGDVAVYRSPNLVVEVGTHVIARCIGHDSGSMVNTFKAGTDNTAAASTDTDLGASVFSKTIDTITYQDNTATVGFLMDTTEGNGNTLEEWGIFASDGTMIARWVDVAIAKTSSNQVQGSWVFTITV